MGYDDVLRELQGLLGRHLYVTLSPATAEGRNVAGFSGVLERGAEAEFSIVSEGDEQLLFILRPRSGGPDGAQFTLSPTSFSHAVWVDGPAARELVIRTGGLDITLMQTGEI